LEITGGLSRRDEEKKGAELMPLINELAATHGDKPDQWPGVLEHSFVEGYNTRSTAHRLTGDLIIFGKYEDRNYYLDLATHEEPREPDKLYVKLRDGNEAEFPFLFSQPA
jgi:hypothetical protein